MEDTQVLREGVRNDIRAAIRSTVGWYALVAIVATGVASGAIALFLRSLAEDARPDALKAIAPAVGTYVIGLLTVGATFLGLFVQRVTAIQVEQEKSLALIEIELKKKQIEAQGAELFRKRDLFLAIEDTVRALNSLYLRIRDHQETEGIVSMRDALQVARDQLSGIASSKVTDAFLQVMDVASELFQKVDKNPLTEPEVNLALASDYEGKPLKVAFHALTEAARNLLQQERLSLYR